MCDLHTGGAVRRSQSVLCLLVLAAWLSVPPALADPPAYVFQALAGAPPGSPFFMASNLAVDAAGAIYVFDGGHFVVRKMTPTGHFSTLAGSLDRSGVADGTGTAAQFGFADGIAVTSSGTVFVADTPNHTIRRITPAGVVSTVAGLAGQSGYVDGVGNAARFDGPDGIAAAADGTVYVTDRSNTVRRVAPDGTVTTIAGVAGATGSADGTGSAARFGSAGRLAVSAAGTVYIADDGNHTIRAMTPDGTVSTVAGLSGVSAMVDGAGSGAQFVGPDTITVDAGGTLYVGDTCTIRTVSPAGTVTTVAGALKTCTLVDGTGTTARVAVGFGGFGVDAAGTVYFLQGDFYSGLNRPALRRMSAGAVVATVLRYNGSPGQVNATGSAARFNSPKAVTSTGGMAYATDSMVVRRISPAGVVVQYQMSDGTSALAPDGTGGLYVMVGCGVRHLASWNDSFASLVAGTAVALFSSDCGSADGTGVSARFSRAAGATVDAAGSIFVADTGNHTIRQVTPAGVVTTLAGLAGSPGTADGAVAAARFNGPAGIVATPAGILYVADTDNHTIRSISVSGQVSTVAGSPGVAGSADGALADARFNQPRGLALDANGTLFVADTGNHTIRMITAAGVVSTIGGLAGEADYIEGAGSVARFNAPRGIAVDDAGVLYVADTDNHMIRTGIVGTPVAPTVTADPVSVTTNAGQTVTFSTAATGFPPPAFQWQVSTNGGGSWAILSDSSAYTGTATAALTVRAAGVLDGNRYRCVVTNVSGSANSQSALLTVRALMVNQSTLRFVVVRDEATGGIVAATPAQSVTVTCTGGNRAWAASADKSWVRMSGGTGACATAFSVSVGDPGAGVSETSSVVTVSDAAAGLSATLTVMLTVQAGGTSTAPFGVFDTPVNGAGSVQGSIAVTGWALDDVGVDRVEIWRDLVSGEDSSHAYTTDPAHPAYGKVFIANALFVDGSRPDVEGTFPSRPLARRAGWGYLLLTWGLHGQGNGPFRLYAYAFDVDAHSTLLGSKAITVDNQHASKPFGAIDTPTYGGTVSGIITNFGWALTPNAAPACTIQKGRVLMSVDSGPLVTIDYGALRTDIAAAFPGFSNGTGAGGSYALDTTGLTDGVHQIGWLVYDDCNRGDGIGSRFFTVLNGSGDAPSDVAQGFSPVLSRRPARLAPGDPRLDAASPSAGQNASVTAWERQAPAWLTGNEAGTLRVRHNFGEWTPVDPTRDGVYVIELAQGGRIEVRLPSASGNYAGRQLAGGSFRDLPIGSSIDAEAGIFYWQPAPGFLGAYDLRFAAAGVPDTRVRVVVRSR